MANKNLFESAKSIVAAPAANTINEAGGKAYALDDMHALAQYGTVGTLGNTYYNSAKTELSSILSLTAKVSPQFIAQTALYCREKGLMKDTPALLCAVLAVRDIELLKLIFNRVIDNGKMLRNFCQIVRSGAVGRKSFGTSVKKVIQRWLEKRSDVQLFKDSIGNDPSLSDVIKMVHPSPSNPTRAALYGYICGKKVVSRKTDMEVLKTKDGHSRSVTVMLSDLPELVQEFEKYKASVLSGKGNKEIPDVPFQFLTALNLSKSDWTEIARNAPFTMTRMNLATFQRHGVFENPELVNIVAARLADPVQVEKSKCFPYQLLSAFMNASDIPSKISNALQEALELSTKNIPKIDGKIYIMVDVSGSMQSPVTGSRGTVDTKVKCIDVASLMAAALLRQNKDAEVIPFHDEVVHGIKLNPHDSVMTNTQKLMRAPGGGTDCSCPISYLNGKAAKGDLIVLVSDNMSWHDMNPSRSGTGAHHEWLLFKKRNPKARLVALDIQANASTQVQESVDVLNVGGFSDSIFEIVALFVNGTLDKGHWVAEIQKIDVSTPSPVVSAVKAGAKKASKKQDRDRNGRFL